MVSSARSSERVGSGAGGKRTVLAGPGLQDLDDERSLRVGAGGGRRSGDGVRRRFLDGIFRGSDSLALSPRTRHCFMRCDDDARTGDVAGGGRGLGIQGGRRSKAGRESRGLTLSEHLRAFRQIRSKNICPPRANVSANVSIQEVEPESCHHLIRIVEHGVRGGKRTVLAGPGLKDLDDERSLRVGAGGGMRRGDGVRRRFFDGTFCGSDFLALSPRARHFFMRCDDARAGDDAMPRLVSLWARLLGVPDSSHRDAGRGRRGRKDVDPRPGK